MDVPRRKGEWTQSECKVALEQAECWFNQGMEKQQVYGKFESALPGRTAEGIKKQLRKLGWQLTQYRKKGHRPEDDGGKIKRGSRKAKVLPEPTAGSVQRDVPSLCLWDSPPAEQQVDLELVDMDGGIFDELVGPEIPGGVGPFSEAF
ncbi:unnamed protein product [Dicrocoelium dendriticum]|nr:unnamed protein product [Dicrocoelium dendriticum]